MKYTINVIHEVEVELDETKFTDDWMKEFREYMYDFNTTLDHAKHLAQMDVRGMIHYHDQFVEGYGELDKMGIKINVLDQSEEEV